MPTSFSHEFVFLATATFAIVACIAPQRAAAAELATARGQITVSQPHQAGTRSPACEELVVEARGAMDNHLIGETRGVPDADGTCRYILSVPAQSAVWMHVRPTLVAGARSDAAGGTLTDATAAPPIATNSTYAARDRTTTGSVAIRWTIVSPNTYFFNPGEQKTVPLSY